MGNENTKKEKEDEENVSSPKSKIEELLADRYVQALLIILIFAAAVRLWYFNANSAVWWDEADYLIRAKAWALGTPITGWTTSRPILLSALITPFFKISEQIGEIAARALVSLFSIGSVALTYLVGKKLYNKKIGLVAAILLAASWVHMFYTARVLVDVPALFFWMLTSWLFLEGFFSENKTKSRNYLLLAGLSLGLGFLARFTVALVAIIIFVFLILTQKGRLFKQKSLFAAGAVAFLTVVPYLYWLSKNYGNPLSVLAAAQKGAGAAAGYAFGLSGYISVLPVTLQGPVIWPIMLLFLIGLVFFLLSFKKKENLKTILFISLWIIIPLAYLSTAHVEDRYLFPILPPIFIIASLGFFKLQGVIERDISKYIGIVIVALILIYSAWSSLSFAQTTILAKANSYGEVREAGLWLKTNAAPNEIIFSSSGPQITYYSDRPTYGFPETEEEFETNVTELKPKYMMLSAFERSPPWAYDWPQAHNETVSVAKYWLTETSDGKQQPLIIIYKFG